MIYLKDREFMVHQKLCLFSSIDKPDNRGKKSIVFDNSLKQWIAGRKHLVYRLWIF